MIRLMCKSKTRKFRRMMFSFITAFSIVVQALSFSMVSRADTVVTETYTAGVDSDALWYSETMSLGSESLFQVGTSFVYTATYGLATIGEDMTFYLPDDVVAPGGSSISCEFVLSVSARNYALSLGSVDIFRVNSNYISRSYERFIDSSSATSYTLRYISRFESSQDASSFTFEGPTQWFDVNAGQDGTYYLDVNFVSCVLTVEYTIPYNEEEVLEDIRDNTAATTDAVNNQTETVTEGYDNSQITGDNEQLAGAMESYDQSQAEAVGDSTGYIDDVSFFDPSNSAQIMSGITLTGSFLQSLFTNMGDWSAVVLVSLSLTFGLMLVGWFKFRK